MLPKFNALNAYFQSEKPVIINIVPKLTSTFKELLSAFLEPSYINRTPLNNINPKHESHQLLNEQMYLGAKVLIAQQNIERSSVKTTSNMSQTKLMTDDFRNRCRMFLQTACIQLQKRFDFENKVLETLHIFDIVNALDSNIRTQYPSMVPLLILLPRCVQKLCIQEIGELMTNGETCVTINFPRLLPKKQK